MNQENAATPDELQQAINSITGAGAAPEQTDVAAQIENKLAGVGETAEAAAAQVAPAPEMPVEGAPIEMQPAKAMYGDPDLDKVKTMALSDLRPILEKVDLDPAKKFIIYKDIIELTDDKACIELAYNAAKQILDEKQKAEALLYIVESIDKLGIPMHPTEEQ